ncbi:MAG: hypothetical protein R2822_28535 [Spirosomataceae bacterium]
MEKSKNRPTAPSFQDNFAEAFETVTFKMAINGHTYSRKEVKEIPFLWMY